jgi:DNA modification methylase
MDKAQLLAEIEKLRGEKIPSTVIYEDRPARSAEHPTMKPVKLFMRLIRNSSKAEDTVLDLFGGSGTTIIACQRTNRLARVMELDPHYCDVIRRRWTKWAAENGIEPGPGALE